MLDKLDILIEQYCETKNVNMVPMSERRVMITVALAEAWEDVCLNHQGLLWRAFEAPGMLLPPEITEENLKKVCGSAANAYALSSQGAWWYVCVSICQCRCALKVSRRTMDLRTCKGQQWRQ